MAASGLLIAAPASNSGKTLVTLGLLRALRNQGVAVAGAKSGPDYIDPGFLSAASGQSAINLDAFAMDPDTLRSLAHQTADNGTLIVEGAMGLFDGAANGQGSAADLAAILALPVILVVDCKGMSQSIAALVAGYAGHRQDVHVAGIILNRVGSSRHENMLRAALAQTSVPVIGAIPNQPQLALPDRHLGLVQAQEHVGLERFLEQTASVITETVDLKALLNLAAPLAENEEAENSLPKPLGQRIAIARDEAFAFVYQHQLQAWRSQGAELSFFSPLADEGPDQDADAVFLPGGYPELHAGLLSIAEAFRTGMENARDRGCLIYGECGGYMTLGNWLVCGERQCHRMLGFLPLETSFAERKLHLGYRHLTPLSSTPWHGPSATLRGHEFHYATTIVEGDGDAIFAAEDAAGTRLPDMGLRVGNVMGSFAHLI